MYWINETLGSPLGDPSTVLIHMTMIPRQGTPRYKIVIGNCVIPLHQTLTGIVNENAVQQLQADIIY